MTIKSAGISNTSQGTQLEQTHETTTSEQIPHQRSSIENQQTETPRVITQQERGRRMGESRIEGDSRRAALERELPRFSNYNLPTRSPGRNEVRQILRPQPQVQAAPQQPAAPRAPNLPTREYDYRNVSGGGIFSRGPNDALQSQHASNMRTAERYAGRYERYSEEYIRRVRNAHSFQELQQLGSPQPPGSLHVGERGRPETARQQQEMQHLRGELETVNNRLGSASHRISNEVANRIRQLSGSEAHGPNARMQLTVDTPAGELNISRSIDQDGPRDSAEFQREGKVRLGRYFRARGEVSSNGEITGQVSVRAPGARVSVERSMNLRGEQETTVEVGAGTRNTGVTVDASSNGNVGVGITQSGITARSEANPRQGTFEQSVSVQIPGTEHKLELAVGFRGISEEDAQRLAQALRGAPGFFDLPPEVIRAMDQSRPH